MKNIGKIAVVMGGPSAEREISLVTGAAIAQALREKNYEVETIDLEPKNFAQQLADSKAQVVFNAVHGLYGEDGRLQSVLEMLDVPYTGSGVLASALAMDKVASKRIFQAAGIPTPRALIFTAGEQAVAKQDILQKFQLPVVVKPASQGSSIGVVIVKEAAELQAALQTAFSYCNSIVVEEFIQGKEITVALLATADAIHAFPVINIVPHSGTYDFKSKYTKGETEYLVPAPLDEKTTAAVQAVASAAYKIIGCQGVARADMMLDAENKAYVLELNTVPGMTATSLVPKAAGAEGISFPDLCEKILLAIGK
ncbi:MAG: D-alanine--D-alanine ligase [Acidaminococcaceae bacterium]